MRKIVTVIGARPQFIKTSVVSKALLKAGNFEEVLIHTGQHFDANMSDVFFSELSMPAPRYNLGVYGGGHGAMTGQMLAGIERILTDEKPDVVLVYGDTNSTLAGALAAAKLHIAVAHVEAGLRSFNMRMPEEINRVVTDRVSNWLFAPTQIAVNNLQHEGVSDAAVYLVGDVMYDVALQYGARVGPEERKLQQLGLRPGEYVLATVHRAENTDQPERLLTILEALEGLAQDIPVVWPVHPRTKQVLERLGRWGSLSDGIKMIQPVGYLDMVQLEKYAALIATDSGGIQKEAYFYGVPCVTLRDETEWVELITAGWNRLAPPSDAHSLLQAFKAALGVKGQATDLYGDGNAAEKIINTLSASLS